MFYLRIIKENNKEFLYHNLDGLCALYYLMTKYNFSDSDIEKISSLNYQEELKLGEITIHYSSIKTIPGYEQFIDIFFNNRTNDIATGLSLPINHLKKFINLWHQQTRISNYEIIYDGLKFKISHNIEDSNYSSSQLISCGEREFFNTTKLYYISIMTHRNGYSISNNIRLSALYEFLREGSGYYPTEELDDILQRDTKHGFINTDLELIDNDFIKITFVISYLEEDYEAALQEQEKTAFIIPRKMLWELVKAWHNLGYLSDKKWYRIALSLDMQNNTFDLKLDENIQQYFE